MIIDCHCHAGIGDQLRHPWNTEARLDRYLPRARAAGIDRTVVFPLFHSDYGAANQQIARIVAENQPALIGFAAVHCRNDAGRFAQLLEPAILRWGFRGIKIHGKEGTPTREFCEVAWRLRVPVLFDVYGQPHTIDILAREYPEIPWIIPHLGSFADDWRVHERVIEQIARYPQVYTDTSGIRRFDYLLKAVRRAGPHKLLFGSDGPWLHPGLELEKIRLLRLPSAEENLILGPNLAHLCGLQEPLGGSVFVPGGLCKTGRKTRNLATDLLVDKEVSRCRSEKCGN